jgi:hypothetical protein
MENLTYCWLCTSEGEDKEFCMTCNKWYSQIPNLKEDFCTCAPPNLWAVKRCPSCGSTW